MRCSSRLSPPNGCGCVVKITPDGKAIANLYRTVIPLAASYKNTATSNNAIYQTPNPLNYREDLGRIDYRINDSSPGMPRSERPGVTVRIIITKVSK